MTTPSPDILRSSRQVLDAAPDGILLVERDGTILSANPAMERLGGYSAAALVGQSIGLFLPPHLRDKHALLLDAFFEAPNSRPMGRVGQLQLLRADGSALPIDIALGSLLADGRQVAAVFIRDMRELRRLQEQMNYQATHDTLTGLANRWMFGLHLEQALAQARRQQSPLALLLLDLDNFKEINDGYGHAVGDLVLVEVAQRLRGALRAGDLLARLGGDEFTVLLSALAAPQDAELVARKLLQALAAPCRVQDYRLDLRASIGLACCPQDALDADTLMRYADMAMYQAKDAGRGTLRAYAPQMGEQMEESAQLYERLRLALQHGRLALHYQPQVDTASGAIGGLEALLRWHDERLGPVPPDRFVPVAVRHGLMPALGDWVLREACRQMAAWAAEGLVLRVSVNVSAQQFRQSDLAERLGRCLAEFGVAPAQLELEITESEAMADAQLACTVLHQLDALGVGVALDDFGTGYSSLSYLRQLPVSRLKIDRAFIRDIASSEGDATLVRAIIALAHTLGLPVVAEGVEHAEQLDFLRRHGCEACQGWLFHPALPADVISALVLRAPSAAQPRARA